MERVTVATTILQVCQGGFRHEGDNNTTFDSISHSDETNPTYSIRKERWGPNGRKSSQKLAHGILLGPAPCSRLVLGPIGLVHVCNLWYQWIIRIRVCQQGADGKQHLQVDNRFTHLLRQSKDVA